MNSPTRTVSVYKPTLLSSAFTSSTEITRGITKNMTPIGVNLITIFVILKVTSLRAVKNSSNGFASSFIRPTIAPKTIENTTNPSILVPLPYEPVIFHL